MSSKLLSKCSFAVVMSGALLALAQVPAQAHNIDLDTVAPDVLDHYLTVELRAMYTRKGLKPNGVYSLSVLKAAILYALSDEGDDEGEEAFIDTAELDDEMDEADTNLDAEIGGAMQEADRQASSHVLRIVKAAFNELEIAAGGRLPANVAERFAKDMVHQDVYCCQKKKP
jgi:hypothetical protein